MYNINCLCSELLFWSLVLTIDINCDNVPLVFYIFFMAQLPPFGPDPHCRSFTITLKHWTPLDEWSARRRDPYQKKDSARKRQVSMPPVTFEPAFPGSDRPQTHALHSAVLFHIVPVRTEGLVLCLAFLFPVASSPCPVLSAIVSQVFPNSHRL
jgi:hypothetical protein